MKAIRQSDRAFGFTLAAVFSIIAVNGWLFFGGPPYWALISTGTSVVVAMLVPGALMPLNRVWGWVAPKIGSINNTIVLGLVFYSFVTPIAILMRIFRRDTMRRSIESASDNYWTPVTRQTDSETFRDLF